MQNNSTKVAECDTMEKAKSALCAEFLQLSPMEKELTLQYIRALKSRREKPDV